MQICLQWSAQLKSEMAWSNRYHSKQLQCCCGVLLWSKITALEQIFGMVSSVCAAIVLYFAAPEQNYIAGNLFFGMMSTVPELLWTKSTVKFRNDVSVFCSREVHCNSSATALQHNCNCLEWYLIRSLCISPGSVRPVIVFTQVSTAGVSLVKPPGLWPHSECLLGPKLATAVWVYLLIFCYFSDF